MWFPSANEIWMEAMCVILRPRTLYVTSSFDHSNHIADVKTEPSSAWVSNNYNEQSSWLTHIGHKEWETKFCCVKALKSWNCLWLQLGWTHHDQWTRAVNTRQNLLELYGSSPENQVHSVNTKGKNKASKGGKVKSWEELDWDENRMEAKFRGCQLIPRERIESKWVILVIIILSFLIHRLMWWV